MTRLRLRSSLLLIAVLTLVGWHALKVTVWVLRRQTYQVLESYHRSEAQFLDSMWNSMRYEQRLAQNCFEHLLINPDLDVQKEIGRVFSSRSFHPFSGPRSGWMDEIEAHQAEIDKFAEEIAKHECLSNWYEQAHSTPWCEPPKEDLSQVESLFKSLPRRHKHVSVTP